MEARELSDSYWNFISHGLCAIPFLGCCGSGLITALAYWFLSRAQRQNRLTIQLCNNLTF